MRSEINGKKVAISMATPSRPSPPHEDAARTARASEEIFAVDPGCYLFLELDRTDGSALTMNSIHPPFRPRRLLPSPAVSLSFPLPSRSFFALARTDASGNFSQSNRPKRDRRKLKERGGQRDVDFPRVPAEYGRLSGRIAENGAIEFASASPSGKMIRSTLIAG